MTPTSVTLDPLRGISRIDQTDRPDGHGDTHAWLVRVRVGSEARGFSDSVYGGVKQSLRAAMEFRDDAEGWL